METKATNRSFTGWCKFFSHQSEETKTPMQFSAYIPDHEPGTKMPYLLWLSGLTCSEQNFIQKAGALKYAAEKKIVIVCPDTSPRGDGVPDEADSWDFGIGAGFYLDASEAPWNINYRMYSYLTKELIPLIESSLPVSSEQKGIFGHSMGGHGALTIALKNPGLFKSSSAFAPICNPVKCKWGQKAFSNYLGKEISQYKEYDTTELIKSGAKNIPIRIDQGGEDNFLKEGQLLPENLLAAAKENNFPIEYHLHDNFDHSYYFISSFIKEHLDFHLQHIKS